MNLVRAELARLFARRFTRIALAGVLVVLALIALSVGYGTHKVNDADKVAAHLAGVQARAQAQAAYQQCLDNTPDRGCDQIIAHLPDDSEFLPRTFNLAPAAPDLFRAMGALLALFGFAVGASFIGAEWSSGGVLTLLLWRPRRVPLWLGKLASALLGVLGVGIGLSALWYATLFVLAGQVGSTRGMSPGVFTSLLLTDARALALALATTAIGYSIAFLGRNTATALGAAVGWAVILEAAPQVVFRMIDLDQPQRWFLSTYVSAWLNNGTRITDYPVCQDPTPCAPHVWTISLQQSALVLGGLVAVVAAASLYAFRRRDVT
jgi:ABC-2 type transport system permease protein